MLYILKFRFYTVLRILGFIAMLGNVVREQRSVVINLYKNLLYMGRDYPLGYEFFRSRCHKVFLRNSKETDPEKIAQMIRLGKYVLKELEAMYMLKKYRTLKFRYYGDESKSEMNEIMRRINEKASV